MNNLLMQAHQLIPYQKAIYFKWVESSTNSNLLNKSSYEPGVETKVKINAVKSDIMRRMGLDYKKNYMRLFSTPKVSGLSRINDGDQFEFDGIRWKVEGRTGWFATAGWDSFVMIEVGPATS